MDDAIPYIERVLNGETEAFRYLVRQHEEMVYSVTFKVLKDPDRSRLASHEAFIKAFKSLKKFRRDSDFGSWLYRIAMNESLKLLQHDKRQSLKFEDFLSDGYIDEDITPPFYEDEKKALIDRAIALLSSDEGNVLRLFYLEGDSIKGIRDSTGWSLSKIKVTLHRARKNMKGILTRIIDINLTL